MTCENNLFWHLNSSFMSSFRCTGCTIMIGWLSEMVKSLTRTRILSVRRKFSDCPIRSNDKVQEIQFIDGFIQNGCYLHGRKYGRGVIQYPDGSRYEGEWMGDLKQGRGIFHFANGDQYVGQFSNNERNGRGFMRYRDGSLYQGEWKDNLKCGQGCLTLSSGDTFEGVWLRDYLQGRAVHRSVLGYFDGYWNFGKMHGPGTFYYGSGSVFEGQWRYGQKQYWGLYKSPTGFVYKGYWENDTLIGFSRFLFSGCHLLPLSKSNT